MSGNVSPQVEAQEHEAVGGISGKGAKRTVPVELTMALDNDGNGNPIYIGKALQGSAKSGAVWQVQKLTYSGTNLTDIQWADGNTDFDNVWDDRASLNYS